jgi:hypothetical protein
MASSGSEKVGLVTEDLGPFVCGNCQKFQSGVCYDKEVAEDKSIPDYKNRLLANGHIMVGSRECCNEFLSLNDKKKWDGKLPKKDDRKRLGSKIIMMMKKGYAACFLFLS